MSQICDMKLTMKEFFNLVFSGFVRESADSLTFRVPVAFEDKSTGYASFELNLLEVQEVVPDEKLH